MRIVIALVLVCLSLLAPSVLTAATAEEAISNLLTQQVAAWNRGDLNQFVSSYAQHCTIVGATISETTREQVLEHYQQKYPSLGSRGKLAFSGLTIHQVDNRVAIATAHWHLDRAAVSGGPVGGVFSLVFEWIDGSWQIVLDHTS